MAIEKAKVYNGLIDKAFKSLTTTADFEDSKNIKFLGGSTVSIPFISTSGNTNYDRINGHTMGAAALTWKDYTFPYDRSFEYLVDSMDQDETANNLSVMNVIADHMENHDVPETDTLRYQDVFQSIVNESVAHFGYYSPAASTVFSQFMSDVSAIKKKEGSVPLRAKMSETAFEALGKSTELSKTMSVQNASGMNEVSTETYKINGVEIDRVEDDLLVTEIALLAGGFSVKPWAQSVNWIIYRPGSIVAIQKRNSVKQFPNGTHTLGDGDLVQGRKFHGCWVLEHQKPYVYVSLKTATIAGFSAAELSTTGATNVTYTIASYATRDTGHKFYYFDGGSVAAKTAPAAYDVFSLTGYVEITVATAVADVVTSGYYGAVVEIDENGRAVRFATIKAA